eukprot:CAMPEP_0181224888 /NCGR_PEP_ID=MMETSP1096-20121128/31384_1 /TAXON_ID=156174 ORGANISM="Chrysochromulina ericina, Strain CCMP281" /NCGR_SAMPLE_ID=MMETSP1096 /ASSEMBLY_ACC=CAM_ASM_000453 /LENGTH=141 /DNA_ID=CAMNT_0023318035 /DNA_START=336 /DNA_END=758 /DNA_ORIENTATION=-
MATQRARSQPHGPKRIFYATHRAPRSSRYCSGWRASVASGSRARRYRHPYVQLELASAHRHPCGKLVALHLIFLPSLPPDATLPRSTTVVTSLTVGESRPSYSAAAVGARPSVLPVPTVSGHQRAVGKAGTSSRRGPLQQG